MADFAPPSVCSPPAVYRWPELTRGRQKGPPPPKVPEGWKAIWNGKYTEYHYNPPLTASTSRIQGVVLRQRSNEEIAVGQTYRARVCHCRGGLVVRRRSASLRSQHVKGHGT